VVNERDAMASGVRRESCGGTSGEPESVIHS
jgi:hypothetical protein